jgi:flagellum-specific peptidoglycan hydrolase FlgJ
MERRELLKMIAAATGAAMIGGTALLSGCATQTANTRQFSAADIALLDEVAETMLPRTDTPGAKDAKVGEFIATFVSDCYTEQEQAIFHAGLQTLESLSRASHQRSFAELNQAEREAFVNKLDAEARAAAAQGGAPHYFTMIKQLTLFGFFTSEPGATQVLRHIAIPGRYEGCAPYTPGERGWAFR